MKPPYYLQAGPMHIPMQSYSHKLRNIVLDQLVDNDFIEMLSTNTTVKFKTP